MYSEEEVKEKGECVSTGADIPKTKKEAESAGYEVSEDE